MFSAYPTLGISLFVKAISALLGLEVAGQALGFALVLYWGVQFPLWSDVAGLGLMDMKCRSGEMTLSWCFIGFARVSVVALCSCFGVPYIMYYFPFLRMPVMRCWVGMLMANHWILRRFGI